MSITGSCGCNNIQLAWQVVDLSMVPRACQCSYCATKSAAYVSKSGSKVEVSILNKRFHKIVQHGSGIASFHECTNCGDVVVVTAEIDGEIYAAVNANILKVIAKLPKAIKTNFSDQSAVQKRQRWRENWCCPVIMPERSS